MSASKSRPHAGPQTCARWSRCKRATLCATRWRPTLLKTANRVRKKRSGLFAAQIAERKVDGLRAVLLADPTVCCHLRRGLIGKEERGGTGEGLRIARVVEHAERQYESERGCRRAGRDDCPAADDSRSRSATHADRRVGATGGERNDE